MESFDYSEKEQNRLFESIFDGYTTLKRLPEKLYKSTSKVLNDALNKGYKATKKDFDFGSPDYVLLNELRENIYIFSAARTATHVDELTAMLYDGDKRRGLNEFKKVAKARFDVYNGKNGYLETEYVTAQTAAASAKAYRYAVENEELFPYLQSHAIIDEVTAPECIRMNGVIARVNDPIWDHNLAPRHFNCRCYELSIDKYEKTKVTPKAEREKIMKANEKDMADVFKFNPVKDKLIFSDEHPYYEVGKRNPDLAKKNFNLPIPKK